MLNSLSLEKMAEMVNDHRLSRCIFFERCRRGDLTTTHVVGWLGQQSHLSVSLAKAFAAAFVRAPEELYDFSRALVELMYVEAWGKKNVDPGAHCNHLAELVRYFGLDLDALITRKPKRYTRNFRDARLRLCQKPRPIGVGLGALIANELSNRDIVFPSWMKGVRLIPGLEGCPVGYFKAHVDEEGDDAKILWDLLCAIAQSKGGERAFLDAERGLQKYLEERALFFDCFSEDSGIS